MIEETHLLEPFKGYAPPPFPCPVCGASLVRRGNEITADESNASRQEFDPNFTDELRYGVFSLRLVCSNSLCTPTIHIFKLPTSLPKKIKKPLLEAFSLYWSNPGASGNSLRIAVEALMDNQCVRKRDRDKSLRSFRLHEKITEFARTNQDIGDKLLAVKWLGNSGSHLTGLKPEQVVTGFNLMQYAVEELFEKRRQRLTNVAKRINLRKGPV
jgi:hypothetical protein